MEIAFWSLLGLLAYVYAGYPVLVWIAGHLLPRPVKKGPHVAPVSILIAAHNEAAVIAETIENKLRVDYPTDNLQIVVVSDGSTDSTEDVVRGFAGRGVVLVRQEPRNGKTAALNLGLRHATGQIVLFADANSHHDRMAVRQLVANFADPAVGYVTGSLAYGGGESSLTAGGCSAYMTYENWIRQSETRLGSIVGVNGGIDAVRRSLYEEMQPDELPDLVLPLCVIQRGYRVVYEPLALAAETALGTPADEYRMRVRVSLRALWTLLDRPALLNVRRYGLYSVQLWSHKVLRYLAPVLIVLLFGCSLMLWGTSSLYRAALVAQTIGAIAAAGGYLTARRSGTGRMLIVPYYFALVNAAALHAIVKLVRGQRSRLWTPRLG